MTSGAVDNALPLLQALLACASPRLDPPAGREVLMPGASVVWDDCCEGQLWVRLVSLSPRSTGGPSLGPCGVHLWDANLEVGVVRCAATVDSAGNPPTPEAMSADVAQTTADMSALRDAVQCCLASDNRRVEWGSWTPLGPQGGCVGGSWTLTVPIDNCQCPPEETP